MFPMFMVVLIIAKAVEVFNPTVMAFCRSFLLRQLSDKKKGQLLEFIGNEGCQLREECVKEGCNVFS